MGNNPTKAENARAELAKDFGDKITAVTANLLDMASVNSLIAKLNA